MNRSSSQPRLKTQTSDLADFLRRSAPDSGSTSRNADPSASQTRAGPSYIPPPAVLGSSKGKRSKIPFLGRTKKGHEDANVTSESETERPRQLTFNPEQARTLPRSAGNTRPPVQTFPRSDPTPATTGRSDSSPPSLGSRLALHFTGSKSISPHMPFIYPRARKSSKVSKHAPTTPSNQAQQSSGPSVIPISQDDQIDSRSFTARQDRTIVPSASYPNITVSVSPPDDNERFHNLFTLPANRTDSQPSEPALQGEHVDSAPGTSSSAVEHGDEGRIAQGRNNTSAGSGGPRAKPARPLSETRLHTSQLQRHNTVSFSPSRQSPSESSSPPRLSEDKLRSYSRDRPPSFGVNERSVEFQGVPRSSTELKLTSADKGKAVAVSVSPVTKNVSKKIPGPLSSLPYRNSPAPSPMAQSFRSSLSHKAPTAPPSVPLPQPPDQVRKRKPSSSSRILSTATSGSNDTKEEHRPRMSFASTRTRSAMSGEESSGHTTPLKSNRNSASTGWLSGRASDREVDPEMSIEQLRDALVSERLRYQLLSQHLLATKERFEAEKGALEAQVEILERESRKQAREIKGLRWLVMNGTPSISNVPGERRSLSRWDGTIPNFSELSTPTNTEGGAGTPPLSPRSEKAAKDLKGKESQSSVRSKRSSTFPDIFEPSSIRSSLKAATSLNGQHPSMDNDIGLGIELIDYEFSSTQGEETASAVSSSQGSPNSPSLLVPPFYAGLSAIPESPNTPRPMVEEASATGPGSAGDRQREKEERRSSRALRRISTASTASASTSSSKTSTSYLSRLRRGRPPTIAQVLDHTSPSTSTSSTTQDPTQKPLGLETPEKYA